MGSAAQRALSTTSRVSAPACARTRVCWAPYRDAFKGRAPSPTCPTLWASRPRYAPDMRCRPAARTSHQRGGSLHCHHPHHSPPVSREVGFRRVSWMGRLDRLVSAFFIVVTDALALICAKLGFGLHVWGLKPRYVQLHRQLFWVAEIGYLLGIILPKASVLLLYGRIFQTNRWRKIVQLGIIFLTKTVVFLFPTALQCSPVSAAWIRDRDAKCIRVDVLAYTWSAMTILEDVLLIALPIPTLCKMRLGRLKRLGIVAQLGAGSMTFVAIVLRFRYLVFLEGAAWDDTWDNVDASIWSMIELTAATACSFILPCRSYPTLFNSVVRTALTKARPTTGLVASPSHDIELDIIQGTRRPADDVIRRE